jgi:integrase
MVYVPAHLPQLARWGGDCVGVQQKKMRHADVATTMNVYGKGMMDSKLVAHTKLLEYAGVGICGVEAD